VKISTIRKYSICLLKSSEITLQYDSYGIEYFEEAQNFQRIYFLRAASITSGGAWTNSTKTPPADFGWINVTLYPAICK
jgi:hypothetical protein